LAGVAAPDRLRGRDPRPFNRMIVGQDDEVKAVVAAALAQAVFKVDEGIFTDRLRGG
jgi:hypothetical protein